jgi:hypothetical protein
MKSHGTTAIGGHLCHSSRYLLHKELALGNAIRSFIRGCSKRLPTALFGFVLLFGKTQLVLAPAFCAPYSIDRSCHCDSIDIGRKIRDLPFVLERPPEPQTSLLLYIIEMDTQISGTDLGDGIAQELPILFKKRI